MALGLNVNANVLPDSSASFTAFPSLKEDIS